MLTTKYDYFSTNTSNLRINKKFKIMSLTAFNIFMLKSKVPMFHLTQTVGFSIREKKKLGIGKKAFYLPFN